MGGSVGAVVAAAVGRRQQQCGMGGVSLCVMTRTKGMHSQAHSDTEAHRLTKQPRRSSFVAAPASFPLLQIAYVVKQIC